MANRTVKSMSFKNDCPIESALLEHAMKHSNFAAYVKRLIQRDMEGGINPRHIKKNVNKLDNNNFF